MMKFLVAPTVALASLIGGPARADEGDSIQFLRPVLNVTQEVTRVVKGGEFLNLQGGLDKAWIMPTSGSLDLQIKTGQGLGLEVMLSGIYYSAPYHNDLPQNYVRSLALGAPRLDASYIQGDPAHPALRIDAGIFNYKYDEYARNLGEYMFRTWAYPGIIQSGGTFNYNGANSATVTGLKFGQSLGIFSHDFIASLETEMTPVYDLNLTYMAKANLSNVLKIGGGVQLARLLNAHAYTVLPNTDDGMRVHYFEHNGKNVVTGALGSGYYNALKGGIDTLLAKPDLSPADRARLTAERVDVDTAIAANEAIKTGDLKPQIKSYTAFAIKPLVYFSFDPKPLLGSPGLFGAKDLVIYGEAAILGAQNHPVYYEKMSERIPMMIGFDLPMFNLLDVFSVELEYYKSRWLPTYDAPQNLNGRPTPFMALSENYYPTNWDRDNLKWSVSLEKSFLKSFMVSAQAASDHSRGWDWSNFGKTPWEIYTRPSEWYWSLKLGVKI